MVTMTVNRFTGIEVQVLNLLDQGMERKTVSNKYILLKILLLITVKILIRIV